MEIKVRTNKLFLISDTHNLSKLGYFAQSCPEGSDCFGLGDHGIGFGNEANDIRILNQINAALAKKNIRLFFIRGNHDRKSFWDKDLQLSNVFLIPDYTEAIFPNKRTVLCVGGGISIDRHYRKEGLDYWLDGITPYRKVTKHYDILLSHDTCDYSNYSTESLKTSPWAPLLLDDITLFEDALNQRNVMNKIVEDSQVKRIFHGHFHRSLIEEKNGIVCCGLDIDEVLELDTDIL